MPANVPAVSIDEVIAGADVVMMLRVQRERLEDDLGDAPGEYLEPLRAYRRAAATAAPNAVVMHPGPMNRGVEIDGAMADDPERSLITLQVEMGVAVRMACLNLLSRRSPPSARRFGPARRPRPCARSSCHRRGAATAEVFRFARAAETADRQPIDGPLELLKRALIGE